MGVRWNPLGFCLPYYLVVLILILEVQGYGTVNPEGLALLEFKAGVYSDLYGALAKWDPNQNDTCRWSGAGCINSKLLSYWAGSKIDRRSTTGYCVFVGGNLILWKSKKQNVVSRSSAEAEYRAMTQSVSEIMWICQILAEIGFEASMPTKLWCDNQCSPYCL